MHRTTKDDAQKGGRGIFTSNQFKARIWFLLVSCHIQVNRFVSEHLHALSHAVPHPRDFSWKYGHATGMVSFKPLFKAFLSCHLCTLFPHKTPLQESFNDTGQPGHRGTTRCLLLPTLQETHSRGCPSAFKLHIIGLSASTAKITLLGHSVPSWTGAGGWHEFCSHAEELALRSSQGGLTEDTLSAHKNPLESEGFCSPRTGKKKKQQKTILCG